MTNKLRIFAAAMSLALLVACSTTEYLITMNDGTTLQSKGEPVLNQKTGMYDYHDLDGRPAAIKKDDVKQILQR